MKPSSSWKVTLDPQGRVVLPQEVARRFGLKAGSQIRLEEDGQHLILKRPTDHLAKVYIEPTNSCNLDCSICMRHVWDEPMGNMEMAVFDRVMAGLASFDPLPSVFFGGYGEPLSHPAILEMIRRAKALGAKVELITNGTLLSKEISKALIEIGLDTLWVSIDGASPESYADVRLGAALPAVLDNLRALYQLRLHWLKPRRPELGIAFVAMQRNIAELPEVIRLGIRLGASRFSISNVLPHTPELQAEMLYRQAMSSAVYQPSGILPEVKLPRMDVNPVTREALVQIFQEKVRTLWNGSDERHMINVCPFIEQNSTSVRWDGRLSPCLPLLHSYQSYLEERPRLSKAYSVGSLLEQDLSDLWQDPEYVALRERLVEFSFSPCTFCNSCEMPESNLEDCFGNIFPTCGGCLWAQGLIQCP
ncbi:MAG: radical SAM protein [Anaerolineae bacterium]|nr:radical SAM protein [Anaerolineae bacterium]